MGADVIHQLLYRDNWDVLEMCMELFDGMPTMMRMCVDFKMTGDTKKEVAEKLQISEDNVRVQLNLAKKRIVRALNGKYREF